MKVILMNGNSFHSLHFLLYPRRSISLSVSLSHKILSIEVVPIHTTKSIHPFAHRDSIAPPFPADRFHTNVRKDRKT